MLENGNYPHAVRTYNYLLRWWKCTTIVCKSPIKSRCFESVLDSEVALFFESGALSLCVVFGYCNEEGKRGNSSWFFSGLLVLGTCFSCCGCGGGICNLEGGSIKQKACAIASSKRKSRATCERFCRGKTTASALKHQIWRGVRKLCMTHVQPLSVAWRFFIPARPTGARAPPPFLCVFRKPLVL